MIFVMPHWLVLLFLLSWSPKIEAVFSPDDVTPVDRYATPNCDDDYDYDYEECIPDEYDDCEPKDTSETGKSGNSCRF